MLGLDICIKANFLALALKAVALALSSCHEAKAKAKAIIKYLHFYICKNMCTVFLRIFSDITDHHQLLITAWIWRSP